MRIRTTLAVGALLTVLVIATVGIAMGSQPAAAGDLFEIESFSAPGSAPAGASVTASVTGDANYDVDEEIRIRIVRVDNGDVVCSKSFDPPNRVTCQGSFTMPGHDVRLRAEFGFPQGETVDEATRTVNIEHTPTPTPAGGDGTGGGFGFGSILEILGNLPGEVVDALEGFVRSVFQAIAQAIVDVLTHVMTSYPDVTNSHVREVHRVVFSVAAALASAMVVLIGLGSVFDVVDDPVKPVLKLLLGLVAGALAPWLLSYPVELSRLITLALKPHNASLASVLQLSGLTLLALAVDAFLLLGLAILFAVRDVYLMFFAAASPLIVVLWATPYLDRYAKRLMGIFAGLLILGPMEMIAFRMTLALLEIQGGQVPHWIYAMGGLVLMNLLPIFLVPISVAAVGVASAATVSGVDRARDSRFGQRASEKVDRMKAGVRRRYRERRQQAVNRFASLKEREEGSEPVDGGEVVDTPQFRYQREEGRNEGL